MEAAAKPARRPGWPLGWVAFSALVLASGFWGAAWLWRFHEHFYYSGYWFLLLPTLWLVLVAVGMLTLGLAVKNLWQLRGWRALGWFLVMSFVAGNCLVGLLPVAVSFGLGTTTEVPNED